MDGVPARDVGNVDSQPAHDSGPSTSGALLFAHGSDRQQMTLATIAADGTGYRAISGFNEVDLEQELRLVGRAVHYLPVQTDRPFVKTGSLAYGKPIVLPEGRGALQYFADRAKNGDRTAGLLQVYADGRHTVLYRQSYSGALRAIISQPTSPSTRRAPLPPRPAMISI